MAANFNTPTQSGGLLLYANLLKPATGTGTISGAPVLYKQASTEDVQQDEASAKKQISAAALRFQPTKRPQLSAQRPKPKSNFPKPSAVDASTSEKDASHNGPPAMVAPAVKSTLADWTADGEDVNGFFAGEKRQRGGRKKRKKNFEEKVLAQDWDDIYDPSRPNSYEEYKHSEERMQEIREWKDRLYAHRMARLRSISDSRSVDDHRDQAALSTPFHPPPKYSFAPPPITSRATQEYISPPPAPPPPPPPPPPAEIPDDGTGEDAYARRMRMSGMLPHPSPSAGEHLRSLPGAPPPAPPGSSTESGATVLVPSLPQPTHSDSVAVTATISRAPVRYNFPAAPTDIPSSEAELQEAINQEEAEATEASAETTSESRSLRPGQTGFADRFMAKYGWTKGTGLGAAGTGIINPLRVQMEKRKQKPDSEGGGFVGPAGKGKIVGGKRKAGEDQSKFRTMSEVVVMRGMLDEMDLNAELQKEGGGLMQEIGEECAEKYGRVERVFIDRTATGSLPVFVKFTSQLSALRAVNALEGRVFNGNVIQANFFDSEKFERGIYD